MINFVWVLTSHTYQGRKKPPLVRFVDVYASPKTCFDAHRSTTFEEDSPIRYKAKNWDIKDSIYVLEYKRVK